ncbi:MAG: DNA-binding protein [Firmicutes bacterium]|nr:DNA-binding protein [Bacillota bacterium]
MEKILENTLLYDFYGELLTEKQRKLFEMHFYDDLSLGEIGDIEGISRQGVSRQLKRGEEALREYEDKLRLVEKFLKIKEKTEAMTVILEDIQREKPEESGKIDRLKGIASSIVDLI